MEGEEGDTGAVLDLAPKFRLGVGSVSSKRWGDGGRKTGEETTLHSNPVGPWFYCFLESAANQHGRASVFFPAVVTCRSLWPISGRCEGGLAREMAASAFHRASLRSRSGATCYRLSHPNFHIANGPNMASFYS